MRVAVRARQSGLRREYGDRMADIPRDIAAQRDRTEPAWARFGRNALIAHGGECIRRPRRRGSGDRLPGPPRDRGADREAPGFAAGRFPAGVEPGGPLDAGAVGGVRHDRYSAQ